MFYRAAILYGTAFDFIFKAISNQKTKISLKPVFLILSIYNLI